MKLARGIILGVLLAAYSVAGVGSAAAQNLCPYDTTGDYTYDPAASPTYLFYGDGQITYDGSLPWYLDDTLACYNVYKTPGYGQYFPMCDIDGDGQVAIDEVYDIYYRVHPVEQRDVIAESSCVEAFEGEPFFFCHPTRYNRTALDIQAIINEHPAAAAILDPATSGPGHVPQLHLLDRLTCTTPGVFPPGIFDALNSCYLGEDSRSADGATVDVIFSNPLRITGVVTEYSSVAQQYGGICTPEASGESFPYAPGFHYNKHGDQGWWLWRVRTLEQCTGTSCACDVQYSIYTHSDYPGQVWSQVASDSNDHCLDLRFVDCQDTTDSDMDGYPACVDQCDSDPLKTSPGQCGCLTPDTDSDADGTPDCYDECPLDPDKLQPGFCGCGAPDEDSDGDGCVDCDPSCGCPGDPNKIEPGICGCGIPDTDSDEDGWPDCNDGCIFDPDKQVPGGCGCGVPDIDTDADGILDCNDPCPNRPYEPCEEGCYPDSDSDGDMVCDSVDQCPGEDDWLDANGNGTPDCLESCDMSIDSDFDGVPDCLDGCPFNPGKTSPCVCGCAYADTNSDGDEFPDCLDVCPSDPTNTCASYCYPDGDSDNDGVCDTQDHCWGEDDLADPDRDGNLGCLDECPYDPHKWFAVFCPCGIADTDTDGDGQADCVDPCINDPENNCNLKCEPYGDTDDDGVCDNLDVCPGENDYSDADEDGTPDCVDGCPHSPAKTNPGLCGCGYDEIDQDGDGYPSCVDECDYNPLKIAPGECGCCFSDVDQDLDGTPDCNDECPNDPDKTEDGYCGCGTAEGECGTCDDLSGTDWNQCPTMRHLGVAVIGGSCSHVFGCDVPEGVTLFADMISCSCRCGGCIDNADCAAGDFCKLPPEAQCSFLSPLICLGCYPMPTDCPATYEPVCGCDEITYDNECFAEQSGASILHYGPCVIY